jgi:transcriptional regulator with XRE-family HTH domain
MGDIDLQIFAERIKDLRSKKKLTQKEFAKKIGVTPAALSAYENNAKNPSIAVAKRIAEAFLVSIDWLCGLTDKENYNNTIWTYSDIIRICQNSKSSSKAIDNITSEFVVNMRSFLQESSHMESLIKDGLIDKELYDMWLEKTLKKYNKPISLYYYEKIVNPFSSEEE